MRGWRRTLSLAGAGGALLGLGLIIARRSTIWPREEGPPGGPPNILLITLDTTRADHLGAYGDTAARTPNLDRLASQGVLFERAISAAPITLPAHVSLLTGRYPFAHGVRNNGNFRVADSIATLTTTLHDRGYRTAAFVSAFVLDHRSGLARGFDVYDDHLDTAGGRATDADLERRGDRTALAARSWLADHAGRADSTAGTPQPFFVWVHLYDPHDPYTPPPPFDAEFRDRPYDGEIAFDDEVVGSILDQIDRAGAQSSTIVAVVGDHGESLGEHEEMTHAMFVYEAVLRVPMILNWPGHIAPTHVRTLVRGVDLTPTLLDLAGMPPLREAQGQTLIPVVRDRASGPASAYAETYFPLFFMNWAPLHSIQDDRWKLIDAPVPELYDLDGDPHERSNLAAREPARVAALRRALNALSGPGAGAMTAAKPDREAAEKLAGLGYVTGSSDPASALADEAAAGMANRPDPKAMIGTFNALRAANLEVSTGRPAEAEASARAVLAHDRSNGFAALILAKALLERGRWRDAISAYQTYAKLVPTSADAHYWIAICRARLSDPYRALEEVSAAIVIDPLYVNARILRAGLLTERGRLDDAASDYREAIDLQPSNAEAHSGYGVLLAGRGEPERGIAELRRALELRPDAAEVRLALGGVLERTGRLAQARAEYERLSDDEAARPDVRREARSRLGRLSK